MDDDTQVAAALATLGTFGVAAALVGVRGEVDHSVVAVALAVTVAIGGRVGGRLGGVLSALMAATSFDFMHTRPYLSLKIDSGQDILITALLLVVGLVVGGLAGKAAEDRRRARATGTDGVSRVLEIARTREPEDVELAVRAEMLGLLGLQDCWFTPDPVSLPMIGAHGELDLPVLRFARRDFELPEQGVAVDVAAYGRHLGYLVCRTSRGVGVSVAARRTAAELGEILGLAMSARATA